MDEIDITLTKTGLRKIVTRFEDADSEKYNETIQDIHSGLVVISLLQKSNRHHHERMTHYRTELWKAKAELKELKKVNEELINKVEL